MMKLKKTTLQELATTLDSSEALKNQQLCEVKGGCSSCEDTRRPPRRGFFGNWG